jgi:hypothetical protein
MSSNASENKGPLLSLQVSVESEKEAQKDPSQQSLHRIQSYEELGVFSKSVPSSQNQGYLGSQR